MSSPQEQEKLSFNVSGIISKSVNQVYDAVADPVQLSSYFTTGGAQGRLETGNTVTWDFHDFPGAFPVEVIETEYPRKIVVQWGADKGTAEDNLTTVTFEFTSMDDGTRTKVVITEAGWEASPEGIKAAFGNCEGWTGMLAAMKAWLEYGINLRDGFYK
ncbi:SRPBCC domain-containing protein [Glutamicibacter sp.]|uniref:SRPBCC domain-containing protein n=1 Tax=Glutamicibacter sp. TaxID=1931995 RepID=UPI002FE072B8